MVRLLMTVAELFANQLPRLVFDDKRFSSLAVDKWWLQAVDLVNGFSYSLNHFVVLRFCAEASMFFDDAFSLCICTPLFASVASVSNLPIKCHPAPCQHVATPCLCCCSWM
jgi:hypothetical protein